MYDTRLSQARLAPKTSLGYQHPIPNPSPLSILSTASEISKRHVYHGICTNLFTISVAVYTLNLSGNAFIGKVGVYQYPYVRYVRYAFVSLLNDFKHAMEEIGFQMHCHHEHSVIMACSHTFNRLSVGKCGMNHYCSLGGKRGRYSINIHCHLEQVLVVGTRLKKGDPGG